MVKIQTVFQKVDCVVVVVVVAVAGLDGEVYFRKEPGSYSARPGLAGLE
jgi:hypothetical protein